MTKVTKEVTAPTNIIPSTPKFNTPYFSVIKSPRAAKTNGVVATKIILIKLI